MLGVWFSVCKLSAVQLLVFHLVKEHLSVPPVLLAYISKQAAWWIFCPLYSALTQRTAVERNKMDF